MKNISKSLRIITTISLGIASLSITQNPANALIFDWQFINEDGTIGNPTDIIAGEVEFNDADVFPNAINVAATRLEITSVTGLNSSSAPFFGDGGVELNTNLVPFSSFNSYSFNASEEISSTTARSIAGGEQLQLITGAPSQLADFIDVVAYQDSDSSTLSFTQQASIPVPFEVDATLGLLLVGGISGVGYFKRKNQEKRILKI